MDSSGGALALKVEVTAASSEAGALASAEEITAVTYWVLM